MLPVLEMEVHVIPLSIEASHLRTLPVYPLRVNVPVVLLSHTNALLNIVPPTLAGLTRMVPLAEFALAQDPLCTTALYCVVLVRFV